MIVAAVPLLVAALGSLIVWALVPPTIRHSALFALAAGPAVGFALVSMAIVASFGLGMGFPSTAALWGVLAVPTAIAVGWHLSRSAHSPHRRSPRTRMDRGEIVLCVLLTVSALLFISSAIVSIQKRPHGSADAISIWNGRARILYRAGNNAEEVFRKLKHGHPDYPLFLSGTIAGQFQMAGHESPRIPQSISVVLATACVGAAALALLCWAGRKSALIGCSILLVTPAFNKWSVSQNSDIPLAYVAVLALLALSCAADRQPGQIDRTVLLLTGFLVGLLVWIKDEGIVLACALLGGALIVLVFDRERKQRWRCVAWMIPGLAVPVLTTAVFKISWVTTSQIVQVAEGNALENFIAWDRWSSVAKAFLTEFSPIHEARAWGFAWLAMGLLAAWRWRSLWSGSTQRLATATVVLAWIGYFTIYLLTPQPLDWHLRTSVQRLFLQLFPLSIAWIGALFGQGGSRSC